MQLEIIYVNKSTILPIDYKMKNEINKIINHSLIHNEQNKLNQLNIFFVSEVELLSFLFSFIAFAIDSSVLFPSPFAKNYSIQNICLLKSSFLKFFMIQSHRIKF